MKRRQTLTYTVFEPPMRFVFDLIFVNGWRIYINEQPGYGNLNDSSVVTHRLNDGRSYICWDAPIPTIEAARFITVAWAHATAAYIATGTFPAPDTHDYTDRSAINAPGTQFARLPEPAPDRGRTGSRRTLPAPHIPLDRSLLDDRISRWFGP